MKDGCPFCDYSGPSEVLWTDGYSIAFAPLDPVAEGHVLVVPKVHVGHAAESDVVTSVLMQGVANYIRQTDGVAPCNIITSIGREATQTVDHLYVHVVPRRAGDGLALPWSDPPVDPEECDHNWQPVSFVFETQRLDEFGHVIVRQPDLDSGRVYCVCMKCHTHTYIVTSYVGFYATLDKHLDEDGNDIRQTGETE